MPTNQSDDFFEYALPNRTAKNNKRYQFIYTLSEAQSKLNNFELKLTIKARQPTYGIIRFNHPDLSKYNKLHSFVGEYGFVVPVRGGRSLKILRGEKPLRYKKPNF